MPWNVFLLPSPFSCLGEALFLPSRLGCLVTSSTKTVQISKTYQLAEWSGKEFYFSSYSTTSFSLLRLGDRARSLLLPLPPRSFSFPFSSGSLPCFLIQQKFIGKLLKALAAQEGGWGFLQMVGLPSLGDKWTCHGGTMSRCFKSGTSDVLRTGGGGSVCQLCLAQAVKGDCLHL